MSSSSNNRDWSGFSRTALSVAVAIVAAAPAFAQNTTSAVGGRVTGADGKPVAGATVSIVHRESGSVNNFTTDAEGRYSVRGLRVGGPYTVTVSKGSEKESRDGIYLALAESLNLDLTLGSNVLSQVVVTGSAVASKFDASSQGAGTSLGRKELDAYASIQRNLQDYARLDPRLAQTDKDRGEMSAMGQNTRFNAITIDGVRTNDTFGLAANNLPTLKQPISIDAIQAVQVNLSNYDVTQQGYTGANINAVTKSGTNDFKGSVYYVYRDDKLAGQRFNRGNQSYFQPAAFKEDTKGFTLGGPIIKDKLFFFANYEEFKSTRSTPSFGPVGSALTNVGITQAQIDAAVKVAKDNWGIDIGNSDAPTGAQAKVKDYLLKLDWNITDKQRASLRYAKTEQGEPLFTNFSATSLSLSSHWYTETKNIETVVGQWFSDWTDNFSTEFKLSTRKYDALVANNANLPEIRLTFTGAAPAGTTAGDRTLFFGTENSRHFNVLRTKTTDAYFAGTWIKDDHEIKFGGDYGNNDVFNAFLQTVKGQYIFRGTDPVALFAAGKPSTYTVQLPQTGRVLDDGAAIWSMANLGLFVQDTWTVNNRLNLTLGARMDRAIVPDSPIANAKALAKFGYDNTQTMDGATLFQPRFGFNYALNTKAKEKQQLRGGFGLFQGAAANVWLSNPFSNTGMAVMTLSCNTTNPLCPPGLVFKPDADNPNTIPGSVPAAAVDFLSPSLRQPSVWKSNLAFDTELPYDLVAGVELLLTKTKDGINYRNLNLGAPVATGPDGRELYYNAAALDGTKCWNGGPALTSGCGGSNRANRDVTFGNVILAERTSKGGGQALTLSLGQNNAGWNWTTAYTYTTAKEVSPLTSSTSFSNYANRAVFNPNEEVASKSSYLIQNRFTGAVNWSKAFVSQYKTTVGLVYEGRSGKPYSWTYKNDMNGDGITGNDLMYIPKAPGSGEVIFRGAPGSGLNSAAAAEARFWEVVAANPDLDAARGTVIGRNSAKSKFANTFDLRLSQEVPGLFAGHKGVLTMDFLNVGNMLNKSWGRIDEIPFTAGGGNGGNRRGFVNFAGMQGGKYVYGVNAAADDYETKQNKGESQWAVQITAKYEF
ncbi:TonB-dependent receptor [Paucibacter soli]|uniref:TonB-dependent receptor n=1 Tax=Paucibacter soli TaxID=3133433 RepID=UPI0030AEF9E9